MGTSRPGRARLGAAHGRARSPSCCASSWRFPTTTSRSMHAPRAGWTAARVARNVAGILLIGVGTLLSFPGVPGQGALTVLVGIFLVDFPRRQQLERALARRPGVLPRAQSPALPLRSPATTTAAAVGSAQRPKVGGQRLHVGVSQLECRHVSVRSLLGWVPRPASQVCWLIFMACVREIGPDRRTELSDEMTAVASVLLECGLPALDDGVRRRLRDRESGAASSTMAKTMGFMIPPLSISGREHRARGRRSAWPGAG